MSKETVSEERLDQLREKAADRDWMFTTHNREEIVRIIDDYKRLRASPSPGWVELPRGIKRVEQQRLSEILSGYDEFPKADLFEIQSLAYEVRNQRLRSPQRAPAAGGAE